MERPRAFVATEQRGEHRKLDRLVERQAGKNFQRGERDHERVGETLQPIVEPLLGRRLAKAQVPRGGVKGVAGVAPGMESAAPPLPADYQPDHVHQCICDEQPRDAEVHVARTCEPVTGTHPRRRRPALKRIPARGSALRAHLGKGGEDLQPARRHDREQRDVGPVGDPDGERLLGARRRHGGRLTTRTAHFDASSARSVDCTMLLFERMLRVRR